MICLCAIPNSANAERSVPEHAVAIRADVTLTLGAVKAGLLRHSADPFVGRLEVAPDIGLIPCPFSSELQWMMPQDFDRFPPRRPVDGHKGTFGHVGIIAGSRGYHGAAVLAARAALKACPGLVSVFTPENVYYPVALQLQAAMVHPWKPGAAFPPSLTAAVIGPGLADPDLGAEWRDLANRLWDEFPFPVVADASALAWLKQGAVQARALRVMTPHPGEAARLLGKTASAVQENRVSALRELSERYGGCLVVLKGRHTLIGGSQGNIFINPTGNSMLAQGGSGDVLAGFIGGLLAQKALATDPARTVRFAVFRHGETADELTETEGYWTIEDLLRELSPKARRKT